MKLEASLLSKREARLAIIAAAALFLTALHQAGAFAAASRGAFDLLSTLSPPRPDQPGAVIVAIDEPSFSVLAKAWPWPRDVHARLIQSLRRAGARTIGFDVVFADPTNAAADAALASATDSHMVLGTDETVAETPQGSMLVTTEPVPVLATRGARLGVTSVSVDPDGVVRRVPTYPNSFASRFLSTGSDPTRPNRLIQYFGGPRTYPYASYYQALAPDRYLPSGYFRGRDVIVGLVVQASPDAHQADAFETSFTARNHLLVPGVEIQATILDNLRHHLWIDLPPGWVSIVLLISGCVVGYALSSIERLPTRLAGALGSLALVAAASWLALRFGRVWISPVEPQSGLIASFGLLGVADFAAERHRRRQIQNAFGQYVAPEIVREIINDPDRVKLGGERKTITVLFADIRGFTTIAEALQREPEKLTQFINEILSTLSEIVTRHGGTIDKYIGDCLMAFWNAPLDDPHHADRALSASIEMIESVRSLDAQFRKEAGSKPVSGIAVGIGVNTGECVVGNMGSHLRFDYTAIGDPVNVASRLEKLSRDYDVPLLVGEQTIAMANETSNWAEVDRIAVRGKQTIQTVYTARNLLARSSGLVQSSRRGDD